MTLTFVFPFDHQPTKEETDQQDLLIADVLLDGGEFAEFQHFMGLPSVDPVVTVERPVTLLRVGLFDGFRTGRTRSAAAPLKTPRHRVRMTGPRSVACFFMAENSWTAAVDFDV